MIKTLTTTQVYTFSNFSKAAQLPAGEALRSKAFDFHGRSWRIKLYPTGFNPGTRDFVAVFVKCRTQPFDFYSAEVAVEILDKKGDAVFDDATAKSTALAIGDSGFSKGFVEFARRRELEAASCVQDDDSVVVRCTLVVRADVVAKPFVFPWRRTPAKADDGADGVVPASPSLFASGSAIDTVAASTSAGVPEIVNGSHTLTISRFSEKKASLACGECVRSVQFRVGGSNWYIKVYPNGHDDGSKDSVSFFLARGRCDEPETTAEFAFELVDFKEAGNSKSAKARRTFDNDASNSEHLGFQRVAAELQSARQMRYDRLIVRCKLGVFKGKPPCPLLAEVPTIAVPEEGSLSSNLLRLLRSHDGADITYVAGGSTFRAHSVILSARSPVFLEEVREFREGRHPWWHKNVDEEDMTADAFEALLYVVYTDELPDMSYVEPTDEAVEALLFAAERYEMPRMKLRTEEWLCSFLTPFTVADILSMAVRYDLQLLEEACVEYATPDHVWEHVKGTEGFNRLRMSCPHIVGEIESKQRKY
ncbi:BTB/POZ and MATH domain-containing protein 4 [Dichanthelium oligosanthes]|uniref:BTB/POZ and MATH domain-containing protein 4 n=1 Tax=Dichanthelium oligosanthes TaxID=888268 RepID=A0A1E5VGT6_9POAL|nr:BTB/POZ and MATH domain-containing protein 4 [Dichanthelium oligosanthes]